MSGLSRPRRFLSAWMASSVTAAPSALSFTTTTSPGMTRMRKNTAIATPTKVGITSSRRRSRKLSIGTPFRPRPASRVARGSRYLLLVEPYVDQRLPGEMARLQIPAFHLLMVGDDALVPQDGERVGLRQHVTLELVHE